MEKKKFCIFCGEAIKVDANIIKKELVCPHCSSVITYRRTVLGHWIFDGRQAGYDDIMHVRVIQR